MSDSDPPKPSSSSLPVDLSSLPPSDKPPVFQKETTGSYWKDVWIAFQRVKPAEDLQNIGHIPCARNSLMSGIATGAGVGVIRALSASPLVACNWAIGSFMLVAFGTWKVCQHKMDEERRKVQRIIEAMPKRTLKKQDNEDAQSVMTA